MHEMELDGHEPPVAIRGTTFTKLLAFKYGRRLDPVGDAPFFAHVECGEMARPLGQLWADSCRSFD